MGKILFLFITVLLFLYLQFTQANNDWSSVEIPIPVLNSTALNIDLNSIDDALKLIENRRVIWVIGKFKVGKTYIVDFVKGKDTKTSDALNNTIGLKLWYDENFVVVDSEGMLQPIGINDPYFIKSFITSLMK